MNLKFQKLSSWVLGVLCLAVAVHTTAVTSSPLPAPTAIPLQPTQVPGIVPNAASGLENIPNTQPIKPLPHKRIAALKHAELRLPLPILKVAAALPARPSRLGPNRASVSQEATQDAAAQVPNHFQALARTYLILYKCQLELRHMSEISRSIDVSLTQAMDIINSVRRELCTWDSVRNIWILTEELKREIQPLAKPEGIKASFWDQSPPQASVPKEVPTAVEFVPVVYPVLAFTFDPNLETYLNQLSANQKNALGDFNERLLYQPPRATSPDFRLPAQEIQEPSSTIKTESVDDGFVGPITPGIPSIEQSSSRPALSYATQSPGGSGAGASTTPSFWTNDHSNVISFGKVIYKDSSSYKQDIPYFISPNQGQSKPKRPTDESGNMAMFVDDSRLGVQPFVPIAPRSDPTVLSNPKFDAKDNAQKIFANFKKRASLSGGENAVVLTRDPNPERVAKVTYATEAPQKQTETRTDYKVHAGDHRSGFLTKLMYVVQSDSLPSNVPSVQQTNVHEGKYIMMGERSQSKVGSAPDHYGSSKLHYFDSKRIENPKSTRLGRVRPSTQLESTPFDVKEVVKGMTNRQIQTSITLPSDRRSVSGKTSVIDITQLNDVGDSVAKVLPAAGKRDRSSDQPFLAQDDNRNEFELNSSAQAHPVSEMEQNESVSFRKRPRKSQARRSSDE